MRSAALGPGSTVRDVAYVYHEQVASHVAVQALAVPMSERDVYKMAAPAGRVWRKMLHLHVQTDSSTLLLYWTWRRVLSTRARRHIGRRSVHS